MRRFLAIIAFCMLDLIITERIINRYGIEMELNPIVRWFITEYGMTATYWARGMSVLVMCAILMFLSDERNNKSADRMLTLAFWLSLGVLVWHFINYGIFWLT